MRIGASFGPATSADRPSRATREVEPQRTPVTRHDIKNSIRRALERINGQRPPEQLVETLTAHASLETASGDKMYNFNFAGIKGYAPSGTTAVLKTREVLGPEHREVVIKDGFRAYSSLDEGAVDYVRTMKSQFSSALAPAARGDINGFAAELKRSHYYTASEADYARGLNSLIGAPSAVAATKGAKSYPLSAVPSFAHSDQFVSSSELSRLTDVLDAERLLGATTSASSPYASSSSSSKHARSAAEDEDDL